MKARQVECVRCHTTFLHKGKGKRKYCVECQVILYDERALKQATTRKRVLI